MSTAELPNSWVVEQETAEQFLDRLQQAYDETDEAAREPSCGVLGGRPDCTRVTITDAGRHALERCR